MTKEEIINETIEYYSEDVNRRSIHIDKHHSVPICKYLGPDNKRCAFSRCVREDKIDVIKHHEGDCATEILDEYGENILKKKYRSHKFNFWNSLQNIHDSSRFWNKNGFTESGKKYLEGVCRLYGLDKSKIKILN